jgi:hypothetical protein
MGARAFVGLGRDRAVTRHFSYTKIIDNGYFSYTDIRVKIVWDENKRQINLAKHGMDFCGLGPAFFEKRCDPAFGRGALRGHRNLRGRRDRRRRLSAFGRRSGLGDFDAPRQPKGKDN